MASSLGQAFLAIVPKLDSSAMSGACDSINSGLSKVGEAGKTAFKAVEVAAAAGATALAAVSTAAYSQYSAYEQLSGGVQKLFGDAADTVMQNAAAAYRTAGMSANQYMEQATSFSAALISSLGGDTRKAAEQADVAMRAMSDNVNVYGSNMTDVQNAFQGFAKQNYTMLDNLKLGYGGTKEEMERLIADANEYASSIGEASDLSIDSFSDIVTAIQLVQEEQNIAGTTAKEATTTLEGSLNSLKASWTNWLTEMGKDDADMGKLTGQLVESFTAAASNAIPRVALIVGTLLSDVPEQIASYAPQVAAAVHGMVADALATLDDFTGLNLSKPFEQMVQGAGEVLGRLGETFGPVLEQILSAAQSVIPTVQRFFEGLASTAGEVLMPAMDALAPVMETLFSNFQKLQPLLEPIASLLGSTLATALTLAVNLFTGVATIVSNVIAVLGSLLEAVNAAPAAFGGFVSQAGAWFGQLPGLIGGCLDSVINAIGSFVSTLASNAVQAGQAFLSGVSDGFNAAVGFVASIPGQIAAAVGDLSGLLWNAGASIVNGLLNGIKSAIGSVYSFVSGIADTIASLKGPIPYDRKVLIPNGMALMSSLETGLKKGFPAVESLVSGMADTLASDMSVSPTLESKGSVYNVAPVTSRDSRDGGSAIISWLENNLGHRRQRPEPHHRQRRGPHGRGHALVATTAKGGDEPWLTAGFTKSAARSRLPR